MNETRTNREGLTFEEFFLAAQPSDDAFHGRIRTRLYTQDKIDIWGKPLPRIIYGSRTRNAVTVLKRAWERGEDPTEWRAWAEKQKAA